MKKALLFTLFSVGMAQAMKPATKTRLREEAEDQVLPEEPIQKAVKTIPPYANGARKHAREPEEELPPIKHPRGLPEQHLSPELYQLHEAAEANNTGTLSELIRNGAFIDETDEQLNTPLHRAVQNRSLECVTFLVQAGADLEAPTDMNFTPLLMVVQDNNVALVQLLIEHGASLAASIKNTTALHIAAMHGCHESLLLLLKTGIDRNVQTKKGNTALHLAARKGYLACVQELLEWGVDTTIQNISDRTAGDCAKEHPKVAKIIKAHTKKEQRLKKHTHKDAHLKNNIKKGNFSDVCCLLNAGANFDKEALSQAASKTGARLLIRLLQEPHADQLDEALHHAKTAENFMILIKAGANIWNCNSNKLTAIDAFIKKSEPAAVDELLTAYTSYQFRHSAMTEVTLTDASIELPACIAPPILLSLTKQQWDLLVAPHLASWYKLIFIAHEATSHSNTMDFLYPYYHSAITSLVRELDTLYQEYTNEQLQKLMEALYSVAVPSTTIMGDVIQRMVQRRVLTFNNYPPVAETVLTPSPLHAAVQAGDEELVRFLLPYTIHKDAHYYGAQQESPLHTAVRVGNVSCMNLLIKAGCSLTTTAYNSDKKWYDCTPFIFALLYHQNHCVKALLEKAPLANLRGTTLPLQAAIIVKNADALPLLIKAGADINKTTTNGLTALEMVIKHCFTEECFVALTDASVSFNQPFLNQPFLPETVYAALKHVIIHHSNYPLSVIEKLIELCDIKRFGTKALHKALSCWGNQRHYIITALLDAGTDVAELHKVNPRCLQRAITRRHTQLVTQLLAAKTPLATTEALHEAVKTDADYVTMLIKAGANLEVKGHNGETPLYEAAHDESRTESLVALLEAGAVVEARDRSGNTPLMNAAYRGNLAGLEILLKHQASIHAKNNKGYSALYQSTYARRQTVKCFMTLVKAGADMWEKQPGSSYYTRTEDMLHSYPETLEGILEHSPTLTLFCKDTKVNIPLLYARIFPPIKRFIEQNPGTNQLTLPDLSDAAWQLIEPCLPALTLNYHPSRKKLKQDLEALSIEDIILLNTTAQYLECTVLEEATASRRNNEEAAHRYLELEALEELEEDDKIITIACKEGECDYSYSLTKVCTTLGFLVEDAGTENTVPLPEIPQASLHFMAEHRALLYKLTHINKDKTLAPVTKKNLRNPLLEELQQHLSPLTINALIDLVLAANYLHVEEGIIRHMVRTYADKVVSALVRSFPHCNDEDTATLSKLARVPQSFKNPVEEQIKEALRNHWMQNVDLASFASFIQTTHSLELTFLYELALTTYAQKVGAAVHAQNLKGRVKRREAADKIKALETLPEALRNQAQQLIEEIIRRAS